MISYASANGDGLPPAAGRPPPISRMAVLSAILGMVAVALDGGSIAVYVLTTGDADCAALCLAGCSLVTGLSAVVLARLARKAFAHHPGSLGSTRLVRFGSAAGLLNSLALLLVVTGLPAVFMVCEATSRIQTAIHLQTIGLAMYSYNNDKGTLPPPAIRAADCAALLSCALPFCRTWGKRTCISSSSWMSRGTGRTTVSSCRRCRSITP